MKPCRFKGLFTPISVITTVITVRNVVAERLCIHRHLSFCSQGAVSQHALGQTTPLPSRHPAYTGTDSSMQHPSMHWGRHPPRPRRSLQRTVRILLECILVKCVLFIVIRTTEKIWGSHPFCLLFTLSPLV